MRRRHPVVRSDLPDLWLITDARNDTRLERALAQLPRGSGLIFRHYHLAPAERRARFRKLARTANAKGHTIVLSGPARLARRWHAQGVYGSADTIARGPRLLRLMTAHSLSELGQAKKARTDAVLLSPVFATRSHPGGRTLGPVRFRLLARHSVVPVIALGGMGKARAQALRWKKWAAIDGV